MRLSWLADLRHWLVVGLVAVWLLDPVACLAKTTGVASDSTLESGPCYQALVDKNAETPTTAPSRELGDACRVENGDVTKAWARVIRLWGADSSAVPDYDSFVHADASVPGTTPIWLAIVSIVLLYGVAATPMRPAAALMRGRDGKGMLAAELVVSLALRLGIGLLLLAAVNISAIALAGDALLFALLLRQLALGDTRTFSRQAVAETGESVGLGTFLADVINDMAGAAIGLLGLAILVGHSATLLAAALLIALLLSAPPLLAARRFVRLLPLAQTVLTAILAGCLAVYICNEPLVAASVAGTAYASAGVACCLVLATIATAWRTWGARLLSIRQY